MQKIDQSTGRYWQKVAAIMSGEDVKNTNENQDEM